MAHRPRVVAVIVLLIVAAVALHGYLPGVETPPRDRPTSSLGSLFTVVAMVVVSMAIIVIAVVTQSRKRPAAYGAGEPARKIAGERRPLTWRMILIAVAVVIAWLLLVALLSRMNAQLGLEAPQPDAGMPPPSGTPRPPTEQPEAPEPSSGIFSLLAGSMVVADDGGLRRRGDHGSQAAPPRGHGGRARWRIPACRNDVGAGSACPGRRAGACRGGRSEPRTARGDHRVLRRDGA